MTWIRVDARFHKHPKVVSLPSDAARWAALVTLCEAKEVEGRWESVAHYRACVGVMSRHLAALVRAGLVSMDGTAVVVHDWTEYQRPAADPTAADRMRRYRASHRSNGAATP